MCLRSLFIVLLAALLGANCWAMSFDKQERCVEGITPKCQIMILAVGQIDKSTPEQFKAIAQGFPRGGWVALSSPGGNLIAGMQLGLAIHEAGLNTTIGNTDYSPPDCLSACAYAFMGGISRKLIPGSRYGMHQFRAGDKSISPEESQKINAAMGKFMDLMRVDRRALDVAQMTSSDQMTILTIAQAQQLKIDTAGQSSLGRWRVEATPDSKLLVVNSNILTSDSEIPVTLGIMPIPNQNNRLALMIYYQSADSQAFSSSNPHHIQIGTERFALTGVGGWQEKGKGYQATFLMPDTLQSALIRAPDDAVISLLGDFAKPPKNSTGTTSANPLIAYFGVGNLRNSLQALLQR